MKRILKATPVSLLMPALFVATFTIACSSSAPSESDGRQFFEATASQTNAFKVRNFTKTNGQGDEKQYTIQYEAELECLRPTVAQGGGLQIMRSGFGVDCNRAGQIVKQTGRLVFVKTEKGWLVNPDLSR